MPSSPFDTVVEIPSKWQLEQVEHDRLRANERVLRSCAVLNTVAAAVPFAVQVWYFLSLKTTVFEIQASNVLEGYSCVPLQRDSTYLSNLTYDECMREEFSAPTALTVTCPKRAEYSAANIAGVSEGPWDYNSPSKPAFTIPTYYHVPVPNISRTAYAHDESCSLPLFKGFELTSAYSSEFSEHNPFFSAYEASLVNGDNKFIGYSHFGLANEAPSAYGVVQLGLFGPTEYKTFVFKPSSELLNVTCTESGTVVDDALLQDAVTNGTLIYIRAHSMETDVSIYGAVGKSITFKPRSIGLTVMYPTHTSDALGYGFAGKDLRIAQRCEAYEAELASQAFEYVYSYCHPCATFANNAPFICTKTENKNVIGEALSLAVSNSFAIFDSFVIFVGVFLFLIPNKVLRPPSFVERESAPNVAETADA